MATCFDFVHVIACVCMKDVSAASIYRMSSSPTGAMALARLRAVVAVMVATACVVQAIYLPGVAPRDFAKVWL